MEADRSVPGEASLHLDLRLVHYFVVLAEQRHFGAAAAELCVAQPSLSRQIRRLEQQVGARLFDRGSRGTTLTEAGRVLLERARPILLLAGRAMAEARQAAEPARLIVGYTAGLIVTRAVRELRRQHPKVEVLASHLPWNETATALLDRRVDAAVARLPFRTAGLAVTVLYEEPRVLLVASDHRLAARSVVTFDDIADEPIPRFPDEAWNAFWRVDPRPDGNAAPGGPLVRNLEDKIELIASGQAVSIAPAGSVELAPRPDVIAIPLQGVLPARVVLATRADDRRHLLTAFCSAARAHVRPGPSVDNSSRVRPLRPAHARPGSATH